MLLSEKRKSQSGKGNILLDGSSRINMNSTKLSRIEMAKCDDLKLHRGGLTMQCLYGEKRDHKSIV